MFLKPAEKVFCLLFLVFTCLSFSACTSNEEEGLTPQTLRVGLVPEQARENMLKTYAPLLDHLSKETGLLFELSVPDTYEDLNNQFAEGKIDLALFGGFTFVLAHADSGALPLVMRDTDIHFTTYYIVKGDSAARSISDLKGKVLAFGSKISTSGHLMPRHFLLEKEISPETFFSEVKYSGSHDETAQWVRDGVVDVGVVNAGILNEMLADGRLQEGEVHVLSETPSYPDHAWAMHPSISRKYHQKIRDAFFALSKENQNGREVLSALRANYYIPAGVDDFSRIRRVAEKLNLLEPRS